MVWPSGKAEDCKSFTPSSNLGTAFLRLTLLYRVKELNIDFACIQFVLSRISKKSCGIDLYVMGSFQPKQSTEFQQNLYKPHLERIVHF